MNYASFGGREDSPGMWNFGWIPPSQRTAEQEASHDLARRVMVPFQISGQTDESDDKVDLTEFWAHQRVIDSIGFAFPGVHQYTGSCVGAGGGNMAQTLAILDVLIRGDAEQIKVIFWLLAYGRSRFYMGDRGPGEGSMGSTFAKAAKEDGFLDATMQGLPTFENNDGLSWYSRAEMSWSDGDASQTMNLLPESRKRLIQSYADIKNGDDLEQAIRNYYTVTTASSLIPNPRVEADGEAYGRVARSGGHQTTFLGVWKHPTKGGRWFKYVNQWGLGWGKRGMCWLPESDILSMIRDGGETYVFSQWNGFPAQTFKWSV